MAYGKRRKNRNRKDGNKRPRRDEKESEDKFGQKREFIKTNESFEKYYKELIPENEFQDFLEALRRPLPLTFRITGTREEAAELRDLMKQHFFDKLKDIEVNGKKCPSPTPLPWYPNEFGWYYAAGRHEIRSVPVFSEFHSFLVQETELGNISRQEAVSMIPPMLLGVQSHHKVLDMCAAPGSKTAQLVEALHGNSNATPEGMIIANDIDTSRCYMLVHQTKRLQTPCFMVTNHNSGQYPNVYIQKENGAGNEILQFDRILCDVPCTGDGTLRKNPMIWRSWSPNSANSLHPLQCDILTRGLQMLKVGGRLVYSTCSFNPAENEAVLAKVLGANPDAYELIDVSKELSELKREPGLHSWKVMDSERNFYTSYDQVPETLKEKIRPSLFPPSAEVAKSLHLERSIRIVPHSQDTGGFFVALIEKKKPVTAIDKKEENEQKEAQNDKDKEKEKEKDETQGGGDRKKRDKKRGKFSAKELKEDPFVFMDQETEDMKEMQSFYKFKNFEYDLLITRTDNESKKQIYLASRTIKRILTAPQNSNLRIINTGMRVFEKRNIKDKERIPCKFRIVQHGLRYMMPFLTAQVVEILESDFKQVLEGISVPFRCFSQFATDGFQKINDGCCTLVYKPVQHLKSEQRVSYIKTPVYLAGWKGKGAVQTLVAAKDRASLYVRLGYFELPESLKAEKNKEAKEEKKTEAASGFVDEENPIEKAPEGNEEGEDDDDEDEDGNEE